MKHGNTHDFEYGDRKARIGVPEETPEWSNISKEASEWPDAPKKEKSSNIPLLLAAIVIAALIFFVMRVIG